MKQRVDDIVFTGFKGMDMEKITMVLTETYNEKVSLRQQLKRYFNSRWYDRYEYEYKLSKGNKMIAFYSDFYYRDDHFLNYFNFINEFENFDYVIPKRLPKEHLNLKRACKMFWWDICNLWLLRNMKMDFKYRICWLRIVGLMRLYMQKMTKYLMVKNYSYGLVYNDSNPYENALVQMMKLKGIHTATLQHGLFDKRAYWKGLEFRASVADDFLAWNLHTKELALECGMPCDKIKVLGIPRYIKSVAIEKNNNSKVFSVVLGSKEWFEENKDLIEFANRLSKNQDLRYFIKYHPACKKEEYDVYIDKSVCIQENSDNETIAQMCERSDFSLIAGKTSVFIDLIYLRQNFWQYDKQWNGKICWGRINYFRSYEELEKQLKNTGTIQNEELFQFYCTTMDVKESYSRYFDLFNN